MLQQRVKGLNKFGLKAKILVLSFSWFAASNPDVVVFCRGSHCWQYTYVDVTRFALNSTVHVYQWAHLMPSMKNYGLAKKIRATAVSMLLNVLANLSRRERFCRWGLAKMSRRQSVQRLVRRIGANTVATTVTPLRCYRLVTTIPHVIQVWFYSFIAVRLRIKPVFREVTSCRMHHHSCRWYLFNSDINTEMTVQSID